MHRRMHPETRRMWEHDAHPLGEHPFFKKHGKRLYQPAFDASKNNVIRSWKQENQPDEEFSWDMQETLTLLRHIMELEAPHIQELEQAAIEITSEVWGIDPSKLRGEISGQVQPDPQPQAPRAQQPQEEDDQEGFVEPEEEEEEIQFPEDYAGEEETAQPHIDHRILMNLLTQGAAAHQYNTLHHLAAEKVNAINPDLLKAYTKLSTGITHTYWLLPVIALMDEGNKGAAVGSEQIQFDDEGCEGGEREEGIVVAKGMCFPVLLHELTKGVMELITSHQISKQDPVAQEQIVKRADLFSSEPWMIMIGPEVWRKFLAVMTANKITGKQISMVIHHLSDAEPEEAAEFIDAVIENPRRASEMIGRFNPPNPEPEEPGYDSYNDDRDSSEDWKKGIEEALMSPSAPTAPTKPKPAPTAPPRPSRPGPSAPDPFKRKRPSTLPQPKFRGEEEFGGNDTIDDIADTIGNEWDIEPGFDPLMNPEIPGEENLGGSVPPGIHNKWDPLLDDHPNISEDLPGRPLQAKCTVFGPDCTEQPSITFDVLKSFPLPDGEIAQSGDQGHSACPSCRGFVPEDSVMWKNEGMGGRRPL